MDKKTKPAPAAFPFAPAGPGKSKTAPKAMPTYGKGGRTKKG